MKNIAIIGLPNVGKTILYNQLTNSKNKVGNWAGTTTKHNQSLLTQNKHFTIYDLAGCYNLFNPIADIKIEENTINYVKSFKANYYINVIDYDNLISNLNLTLDILSLKVPTLVVINHTYKNVSNLDIKMISNILGTNVLLGNLLDNNFINQIIKEIQEKEYSIPDLKILYPKNITQNIKEYSKINLFNYLKDMQVNNVESIRIAKNRVLTNIQKRAFISSQVENINKKDITSILDFFFLNKYTSLPLFFIIIYLLFKVSIGFGSILQDLITNLSNYYIFHILKIYIENFIQSNLFFLIFFDGLLASIILVLTFTPVLFLFFFFLSILEQTGYLSRVAFIMDRFMNLVGLTGKSIIPITIGFGCTVPSILGSNMIESKNKRHITMLSSHFVSCTARLAIYTVLVSIFVPSHKNLIIVSIYVLGIIILFLSSYLLNIFSPNNPNDNFLIMELPKYRSPKLKLILPLSFNKLSNFIFKAGMLIIPLSFILTILSNISLDFSLISKDETIKDSILYFITSKVNWIFEPLGFATNNYESTVAIFIGLIAKEGVIGALDSLYTNTEAVNNLTVVPNFFIQEVFNTIKSIKIFLTDSPFRLDDNSVNASFLQENILNKFGNLNNLYTYLIFVSLYSPCISALSALKKETNIKFTVFAFIYTSGIAYFTAFVFHFISNFSTILIINILFTSLLIIFITILIKKIMDLIKKFAIIKYN